MTDAVAEHPHPSAPPRRAPQPARANRIAAFLDGESDPSDHPDLIVIQPRIPRPTPQDCRPRNRCNRRECPKCAHIKRIQITDHLSSFIAGKSLHHVVITLAPEGSSRRAHIDRLKRELKRLTRLSAWKANVKGAAWSVHVDGLIPGTRITTPTVPHLHVLVEADKLPTLPHWSKKVTNTAQDRRVVAWYVARRPGLSVDQEAAQELHHDLKGVRMFGAIGGWYSRLKVNVRRENAAVHARHRGREDRRTPDTNQAQEAPQGIVEATRIPLPVDRSDPIVIRPGRRRIAPILGVHRQLRGTVRQEWPTARPAAPRQEIRRMSRLSIEVHQASDATKHGWTLAHQSSAARRRHPHDRRPPHRRLRPGHRREGTTIAAGPGPPPRVRPRRFAIR